MLEMLETIPVACRDLTIIQNPTVRKIRTGILLRFWKGLVIFCLGGVVGTAERYGFIGGGLSRALCSGRVSVGWHTTETEKESTGEQQKEKPYLRQGLASPPV